MSASYKAVTTAKAAATASSRWLPFTLIGLGFALVVSAIAFPILLKPTSASNSAPIPSEVAGFSLTSEATGAAALQEFNQMHGESFPVLSGAKAVYGPGNEVMIWAAGTASVTETRKLLEEMRDKIANSAANSAAVSRSPFQPTGVRTEANREVYALDGMGQKHFYFQSGKYLVWLAANADIAEQALRQTLSFYQ